MKIRRYCALEGNSRYIFLKNVPTIPLIKKTCLETHMLAVVPLGICVNPT